MSQLDKKKQEMAKKMLGIQQSNENRKYGELIIQTNKVQSKLIFAIILNSRSSNKKYHDELSGKTLGSLIFTSQACIQWPQNILDKLNEYKNDRDKLAHKMYTPKKLTLSECERALVRGRKILVLLDKFILSFSSPSQPAL
ncbi:hypothetical protein KGQ34_00235 [Patescibacteria group bacterium]|nr:hypothetical protein [Patescibacteria group bacterium]